ncbi:MAG: 5-formyltetrahydrofolate cyclo-ligase [Chloroherpetonaceae bacterium]|nr:5-formyltetrahydrofolate cyclo-ligase [Chloroherpetonaceae bacterium]MCS7212197.1 5-formyltetrahydrofolate cyclo-ligase [Chloroherpetonaceae bacterium]MDW8018809.1 5-formyltetrahydrofolate cyclo-ligase [Chloroherpetonaceae bacterium]MDW8467247.1 5-formyltetrahydrofolate cyclo-ligase [Chloroherpetonaceae bacterium]
MESSLRQVLEERAAIRSRMAEQRAALSEAEWLLRSQKIFEVLKSDSTLQRARVVHCFISIAKRREVNTEPILKWLQEQGKEVLVPVMKARNLLSARFLGMDKLASGVFEVLEPIDRTPVDDSQIEVVLTPLLACDRSGNRLGYGKGFYDNFFSRLASMGVSPRKIGLAFSFQILDHIPQIHEKEHKDIPLDAIATETGLIEVVRQST